MPTAAVGVIGGALEVMAMSRQSLLQPQPPLVNDLIHALEQPAMEGWSFAKYNDCTSPFGSVPQCMRVPLLLWVQLFFGSERE